MVKDFNETDLQRLIASTKEAVFHSIAKSLPERFAYCFDDVVQETYLRAWKRLKKENNIENLRGYLVVIARNESYRLTARLVKEEEKEKMLQQSQIENSSHETNLDTEELLANVPAVARNTVQLYLQGVPQKEIATIEKVQPGTVKSRIHRAKKTLIHLLKKGDRHE